MKLNKTMERTSLSTLWKGGATVMLALVLLAGCLPGAKAPQLVDHYTLDYTPPFKAAAPFADSLRVERFSVAQSYNTTAMIYAPAAYRMSTYGYARWRVNPGDLITDYLARDLRSAGLFLGVFTYRETEDTRFVIEGGIEEFLETDDGSAGKATVSLNLALLDARETDITKRLIFQKTYRATERLKEQSSAALAQGMSAAVRHVSEQISKDISEAIARLGKK